MPRSPAGRPAARVGDGVAKGVIVQGEPTVLIGGAAKPVACKACKADAILAQGFPVNAGSGAKILADDADFALPAPRPLAWTRFYASDTPLVGLLGQGWRTLPEVAVEADARRTRFLDLQGRWIDFAPLAPGEAQACPSEGLWLARGDADPATVWDGPWQWLPDEFRKNAEAIVATAGDGDYLVFTRAGAAPARGADDATGFAGAHELTALVDRNGYATRLVWQWLADAREQLRRVPGFLEDSAGRVYRLHYLVLPEAQRPVWATHRGSGPDGAPLADPGLRLAAIDLVRAPAPASPPVSAATLRRLTPLRRLASYRFGPAGDLVEVRDRHDRWTARFAWRDHLMVRQQRPGNLAPDADEDAALDDSGGLDVLYDYDGATPAARVVRQRQRDGLTLDFAYGADETTVTDSLGRATRYRFAGEAGLRRLVELIRADGSTERRDYTADGRLATVVDPPGRTTRYQYDAQGALLGHTDPAGGRHSLDRDPATGLVTALDGPDGLGLTCTRDPRGNLTTVTAADGSTTRFRYATPDLPDRPSEIVDAKGGTKTLAWTALGQLARHTDCSGRTTQWEYEAGGDADGGLARVTDAEGRTMRYRRDAKGRLAAIEHPEGHRETYDYDAAGRLVRATDAGGRSVVLRHDRYGRIVSQHTEVGGTRSPAVRFDYDAAGRLERLTDAAGATMQFRYDALDRLVEETGFDGKRTTYRYDAAGEPVARTEADGTPDAVTLAFEYDALGRLVARHLPVSGETPADTHRFARDRAGRLTAASTRDSTVELGYDAAGRLVRETQSTPDGFRRTLLHAYDALGDRTRTTLPDGQQLDTLRYGAGHWHRLAWNGRALVDVERDALHRETLRSHARFDREEGLPLVRRHRHTPLGQLAATSYHASEAADAALLEATRYRYDGSGLLTAVEREHQGLRELVRYAYDIDARLASWELHEARAGQPAVVRHHARYAFDAAGNPVDRPASHATQATARDDWTARALAGWRDPAFNLLGEGSAGNRIAGLGGVRLTYDGRGNVVRRETEAGHWDFAWDALNRLARSRFTPAGHHGATRGAAYRYDAFGRRIARQLFELGDDTARGGRDPATTRQRLVRCLWDGDRLLQEILPPGRTLDETATPADPDEPGTPGSRPLRDLDGAFRKTYVYEPESFVPVAQIVERDAPDADPDEDEDDSAVRQSLLALLADPTLPAAAREALQTPLANTRTTSARVQYFLTDHLGTPARLIDGATHETLWTREQDPWGNTLEETASKGLDPDEIPTLRFQGQQFDRETGLHYNRFRYYDPKVGRYASQDPLGLVAGLNSYAYVDGNPIRHSDPLGLDVTLRIANRVAGIGGEAVPTIRPDGLPLGAGCGDKGTDLLVPDSLGRGSFMQACTRHDDCFGTPGSTYKQCNDRLGRDMSLACKLGNANGICSLAAQTYPAAIDAAHKIMKLIGLETPYEAAQREAASIPILRP